MSITDGREYLVGEENDQRHCQDVLPGLGGIEREGISTRDDSHSIFYSNSERGYKARPRASNGGEATPGGIYRRLKELNEACLRLIESQQQQLQASLQESKQITTEMISLQSLLAETLGETPNDE